MKAVTSQGKLLLFGSTKGEGNDKIHNSGKERNTL